MWSCRVNRTRIDAVVFDLDGTLVNSEHIYKESWLEVLPRWGVSIDPDDYGTVFAGRPGMDTAQNHFGFSFPEATALLDGVLEHFWSIAAGRFEVVPGLLPMLDRLGGLPLGIATSGRRVDVQRILSEIDLIDRFQMIVTVDDVENGKPHPEPFLRAARGLGIPPERCLAFEDAPNGLRSAAAAGMYCVGVGPNPDVLGEFANAVIADFADPELERVLRRLGLS
jgi:HAD superfamily hydrolase (TIGR01509 family)